MQVDIRGPSHVSSRIFHEIFGDLVSPSGLLKPSRTWNELRQMYSQPQFPMKTISSVLGNLADWELKNGSDLIRVTQTKSVFWSHSSVFSILCRMFRLVNNSKYEISMVVPKSNESRFRLTRTALYSYFCRSELKLGCDVWAGSPLTTALLSLNNWRTSYWMWHLYPSWKWSNCLILDLKDSVPRTKFEAQLRKIAEFTPGILRW